MCLKGFLPQRTQPWWTGSSGLDAAEVDGHKVLLFSCHTKTPVVGGGQMRGGGGVGMRTSTEFPPQAERSFHDTNTG